MNSFIITLLFLSLSGTVLSIVLFALKPFIKHRISAIFRYYLWLVVLIRLFIPITTPLINIAATFPISETRDNQEYSSSEDHAGNASFEQREFSQKKGQYLPGAGKSEFAETHSVEKTDWEIVLNYMPYLWIAGMAVYLGSHMIPYLYLLRKIKKENSEPHSLDSELFKTLKGKRHVRLQCNSFLKTPILVGVFKSTLVVPNIAYVKNGMRKDLENIIVHELTHYSRRDILYKWFVLIVSTIHWFNPVLHFVQKEIYSLCELACDESVIKRMTRLERQSYGNTLLSFASINMPSSSVLITTFSDEKNKLQERLVSIMKYKKKTVGATLLTLILAVMLAGCAAVLGAPHTNHPQTTVLEGSNIKLQQNTTPDELVGLDFDGDGVEDHYSISYDMSEDNPNACLTIELGNGSHFTKQISGYWDERGSTINAADLNNDKKDEIVLFLEIYGGNYGGGDIYVLNVDTNGLHEFPHNFIKNQDISIEQPESYRDENYSAGIGAGIIRNNGNNDLYIKNLIDAQENTAWLISATPTDKGLKIKSMELTKAVQ